MKTFFKDILTKIFVRLMQKIIKKHQPKVIAVVGSVGKTSTKFAVQTVLSEKLLVLSQSGNYNVPLSVPFVFLGRALPNLYNPFGWLAAWLAGQKILHGQFLYDAVVVEIGTDKPGDILEFKNILHPDITIVTAVAEEHMEFFATLDAVAKDELSITQFSDVVVLNADDIDKKYVDTLISADTKTYSYGFGTNDYTIDATQATNGYDMTVRSSDKTFKGHLKVVSTQAVKSATAAVAVADLLGLTSDEIAKGLTKIESPPGRMHVLQGVKNSTILDDSYNASPIAVTAALQTLYEINAPQRIAILGKMNELGQGSGLAHQKIGALCDPKKLDLVITVGSDANNYLADAAEQKGCKVLRATSPYHAGQLAKEHMQDGALILAKGSQNGVFTEEAVKLLLANKADSQYLVRQSKIWLNKKQKQFKV